jgi:antitoxin MazE
MLIKDIELKKWGNTRAVRIGKAEYSELGLSENQVNFTMVVENGKIILTPKKDYPGTLDELFAGYDGAALSSDDRYDWGEPVGREII